VAACAARTLAHASSCQAETPNQWEDEWVIDFIIGGLQDIVRAVKAGGASLRATEQPIDTSTAVGNCFLDMLGVFA
jgi:hypothetical protein